VVDELTQLFLAGRDGDRSALAVWVRRLQPDVWRLCAALVDRSEADDLTQETFVRAFRSASRFRVDSSSRTWLFSIARRVCVDAVRARVRWRRLSPKLATPIEAHLGSGVEVEDLLSGLDENRRAAFVLTQLLGLSYGEAAAVCGCPVGTIRSRVARAREDLVSMLDEGRAASS
jgi:RNA polymerase sigma-70 factor (ECF subfamily)